MLFMGGKGEAFVQTWRLVGGKHGSRLMKGSPRSQRQVQGMREGRGFHAGVARRVDSGATGRGPFARWALLLGTSCFALWRLTLVEKDVLFKGQGDEAGDTPLTQDGEALGVASDASEERSEPYGLIPGDNSSFVLDMIFERMIGKGALGKVYLVQHRLTKRRYAAKVISKELVDGSENAQLRSEFLAEAELMEKVGQHENIGGLLGRYETRKNYILLFELIEGGELFSRIVQKGRLCESEVKSILRQLCEGLVHLHAKHVVHCDIKPENILLSDYTAKAKVKIVDFGASLMMAEGGKVLLQKPRGTAAYRAPEMILHEPCDEKLDIWGLGLVMYILLTGTHPFDQDGSAVGAKMVLRASETERLGEYLEANKHYGKLGVHAKDLIRKCLRADPSARPSAAEMLAHPYLSDGGAKDRAKDRAIAGAVLQKIASFERNELVKVSLILTNMAIPTDVGALRDFYQRDCGVKRVPVSVPVRAPEETTWTRARNADESIRALDKESGEHGAAVVSLHQDAGKAKAVRVLVEAFSMLAKGAGGRDGDRGYIEARDLRRLFVALGQDVSEAQVQLLVRECDLDGDEMISLEEFIGMVKRRVHNANDTSSIKAMFAMYDRDGDGVIDVGELTYLLRNLDRTLSEREILEILGSMDRNQNGVIEYDEFEAACVKLGKSIL